MTIDKEILALLEGNNLSREILNNPYCSMSAPEMCSKWQQVQALVPKRDAQLQQEQLRQQCSSHKTIALVLLYVANNFSERSLPAIVCRKGQYRRPVAGEAARIRGPCGAWWKGFARAVVATALGSQQTGWPDMAQPI